MSIFLSNKYTRCYFAIIAQARLDNEQYSGYTEKHHVIPKSMGGGNNKENLVRLTARQHFVCHLLLTRMVEGKFKRSAWRGLRAMALMDRYGSRGKFRVTSRVFDKLRLVNQLPDTPERKETRRIAGMKRPKHSDETKILMRQTWAERNGVAKKYISRPLRWKAVSPDGETFEFENLLTFCQVQNLDKPTISLCIKSGKAIPPMQRNRVDTSEMRKNTIGWFLEKQR